MGGKVAEIKASETILGELFNEKLYVIPDFQRPFSWGKKSFEKLLEDLNNSFEYYLKNQDQTYFIGAIHIAKKSGDRLEILDGQQRFTFFYLLFIIIRFKWLKFVNNNIENKKDLTTLIDKEVNGLIIKVKTSNKGGCKRIGRIISHSMDEKILHKILEWSNSIEERKSYKINTWKALETDIFEKMEKDDSLKHFIKTYKNAIELIYKFLKDKFQLKNNIEKLEKFIEFIKTRVEVIEITFKNAELDYTFDIFLNINNSGKGLSQIDLIKTSICKSYHNIYEKNADEQFKETWTSLLSGSITKKGEKLEDYLNLVFKCFITHKSMSLNSDDFNKIFEREVYDERSLKKFMQILSDEKKFESFKCLIDKFEILELNPNFKEKKQKILFNLYLLILEKMKWKSAKVLVFNALYNYKKKKIDFQKVINTIEVCILYQFFERSIKKTLPQQILNVYLKVIKKLQNKEKNNKDINGLYSKRSLLSFFKEENEKFKYEEPDFFKSELKNFKGTIEPSNIELSKIILTLCEISDNVELERIQLYYNKLAHSNDLDHIVPQRPKDNSFFNVVKSENGEIEFIKINEEKWFWKENQKFHKDFKIKNSCILFKDFQEMVINFLGNHQFLTKEKNMKFKNKDKRYFESYNEIIIRKKKIIENFLKSRLFKF